MFQPNPYIAHFSWLGFGLMIFILVSRSVYGKKAYDS